MSTMSDLDEQDLASWSEPQADALRRRASNAIDGDNVAEEIESLGRSDRRDIRNRLAVICEHLLKCRFQPDRRSVGWDGSAVEQGTRIPSGERAGQSLYRQPRQGGGRGAEAPPRAVHDGLRSAPSRQDAEAVVDLATAASHPVTVAH